LAAAAWGWVYQRSAKTVADNLRIEPLAGSPGHQLTRFPGEKISDFDWSPAGETWAVEREHQVADGVLLREEDQSSVGARAAESRHVPAREICLRSILIISLASDCP
jgi:hypothetical protein